MKKIGALLVALTIGFTSFSQIREIPSAVTEAFSRQYPAASNISYQDNLLNIQVRFVLDSIKWTAKYNADGEWKETEKQWSYNQLPAEVKDGFQKSKYARGWKQKEASIIYLPGDETLYRIKVEKNDVQKKYLFFDEKGVLVRDALTI